MKVITIDNKVATFEQYVIDTVYKLRTERNMTQGDIARVIGTGTSFIGNVENLKNPAKYNLKHINMLAAKFQMSPKEFIPACSDHIEKAN